eukprot:Gb_20853 [translate_table: standard]
MYTDTVQKLPTNADTNTLKMHGAVPRFNYLPISAPILLANGPSASTMHQTSSDNLTARSSWRAYTNGELSSKFDFEDTSSFGVATPLLKSLMSQVLISADRRFSFNELRRLIFRYNSRKGRFLRSRYP